MYAGNCVNDRRLLQKYVNKTHSFSFFEQKICKINHNHKQIINKLKIQKKAAMREYKKWLWNGVLAVQFRWLRMFQHFWLVNQAVFFCFSTKCKCVWNIICIGLNRMWKAFPFQNLTKCEINKTNKYSCHISAIFCLWSGFVVNFMRKKVILSWHIRRIFVESIVDRANILNMTEVSFSNAN